MMKNVLLIFCLLILILSAACSPDGESLPISNPDTDILDLTNLEEQSLDDENTIRNSILDKAKIWVDLGVPYSTNVSDDWGYRTDCSGFVSYAWGIDAGDNGGHTTDQLHQVAYEISIDNIKGGDIFNIPKSGNAGHAIIFIEWIDKDSLTFRAYEENGFFGKAVLREDLQLENKNGQWYIPAEGGTGPYIPMRLNALPGDRYSHEQESETSISRLEVDQVQTPTLSPVPSATPTIFTPEANNLSGEWVVMLKVNEALDSVGSVQEIGNGSWVLDLIQDGYTISGSSIEGSLCMAEINGSIDTNNNIILNLSVLWELRGYTQMWG
jgi:hypothetical protein